MIVQLTDTERRAAMALAQVEIQKAEGRGYRNHHGFEDGPKLSSRDVTRMGKGGEFAVAKLLGLPFPTVASLRAFKGADLGDDIQVRTSNLEGCRLIVRPADPMDHRFVAVQILGQGRFDVLGWRFGRDCQRPEWARGPNGRPTAWFVDRQHLRQVDELRRNPARPGPAVLVPVTSELSAEEISW